MEGIPDELAAEVRALRQAVTDLERRVGALEGGVAAEKVEERTAGAAAPEAMLPAMIPSGEELAAAASDQVVPLFGWAFLGLAGAYLLRASNEAGLLPGISGAVVGIAYAGLWLLLASRASVEKPLFSTVHGLTAALILTPLLWETTVRFGLLGTGAASAIVSAFAVWGLAIAWKRNLTSIAWIVTVAGLLTSTALFREKHDAASWMGSVLFIAMAVEFSACKDHWLSLRWMTAMAADLTVLLSTVFIMTFTKTPEWAPSPRLVLAAQIALLTIYLASTVDRTIIRGLSITSFEIGQACVAFAVSIGGAFYMAEQAKTGSVILGVFCVVGGVACYLVSFAFLDRRQSQGRNFHTYSTFAILLTSAGMSVLLASGALAAGWSLLAATMMTIGLLGGRTTLRVHAALYLLLGVMSASLLGEAWSRILRGDGESAAPLSAAYLWVLVGLALVYAILLTFESVRVRHWTDRIESTATAALLLLGGLGMLSEALRLLPMNSAAIRTGAIICAALALSAVGARWQRPELTLLVFPLLALAGYKILMDEFQSEKSANLVVSLIFFGGALILLPRLRRMGRREAQGS